MLGRKKKEKFKDLTEPEIEDEEEEIEEDEEEEPEVEEDKVEKAKKKLKRAEKELAELKKEDQVVFPVRLDYDKILMENNLMLRELLKRTEE